IDSEGPADLPRGLNSNLLVEVIRGHLVLERRPHVTPRRRLLHFFSALLAAMLLTVPVLSHAQRKPNILVIFGDDVGQTNLSAYSLGVMGFKTPNIDRIAKEGMLFTDYYAENSCTAGRSTFITGQSGKRTGLLKVGVPGMPVGLQDRDIT